MEKRSSAIFASRNGSRLSTRKGVVSVRRVNLLRFFPLLIVGLFLNGCATTRHCNFFIRHALYRTVRVTDFQGHLVAEYVAEGPVWRYGPGYRFTAFERVSGGPIPMRTRYEFGRDVVINGVNIVVRPCEKPEWLRVLDGF
jgi:hypothetical protein